MNQSAAQFCVNPVSSCDPSTSVMCSYFRIAFWSHPKRRDNRISFVLEGKPAFLDILQQRSIYAMVRSLQALIQKYFSRIPLRRKLFLIRGSACCRQRQTRRGPSILQLRSSGHGGPRSYIDTRHELTLHTSTPLPNLACGGFKFRHP